MATEQKEEWNEVDVPETSEENKVEYEVEGEEDEKVKAASPVETEEKEAKPEEQTELFEKEEVESKDKTVEEPPKELEGIETKGAQRRIKQLIRQRKERDEQIQQLIKEQESLRANLYHKDLESNKLNKLNIESTEKQLNDKITLARASYQEAFEGGNKEKLLAAQEALNEAQIDLKTLGATKYQIENTPQPQQPMPAQQPVQQGPDPKAEEWAANNEWFGPDRVMTASALAIDAELKAEGYDPSDSDFYNEINKRMEAAFPHKFKGEAPKERTAETSKPAQVVSGSSRTSRSSKNKIKLTKEDVRLAQKWGIPLEKYAQEKQKTVQADGEYTTV